MQCGERPQTPAFVGPVVPGRKRRSAAACKNPYNVRRVCGCGDGWGRMAGSRAGHDGGSGAWPAPGSGPVRADALAGRSGVSSGFIGPMRAGGKCESSPPRQDPKRVSAVEACHRGHDKVDHPVMLWCGWIFWPAGWASSPGFTGPAWVEREARFGAIVHEPLATVRRGPRQDGSSGDTAVRAEALAGGLGVFVGLRRSGLGRAESAVRRNRPRTPSNCLPLLAAGWPCPRALDPGVDQVGADPAMGRCGSMVRPARRGFPPSPHRAGSGWVGLFGSGRGR